MAGQLTISTLNDSAGVLATQNGMSGIAKAWVNFNGTGTVAIRASFNVSSITDNGVGDYTVNFTTAMPDANYAAPISCSDVSGSGSLIVMTKQPSPQSTTSLTLVARQGNTGNYIDLPFIYVAIFR